jgi:tetratricopeptide (TPR) repeat protein
MQDEIVTHLAGALALQLPEVEAARLKCTPPANPDAEDLALQCLAAAQKAGYYGKEAEAGYRLCEQALAIDHSNALALVLLAQKFETPVDYGSSADPKADLRRADVLTTQALSADPNLARANRMKGAILHLQGQADESIAECERALALDPSLVDAMTTLAWGYAELGQFENALEYNTKAIRLSPRDPRLFLFHEEKARDYFGLKQYDKAIESARQSIAIRPDFLQAHRQLAVALAMAGHEAEAREALRRYLALPNPQLKTIAAWKAYIAQISNSPQADRRRDYWDRTIEGLRKAGMPEE